MMKTHCFITIRNENMMRKVRVKGVCRILGDTSQVYPSNLSKILVIATSTVGAVTSLRVSDLVKTDKPLIISRASNDSRG